MKVTTWVDGKTLYATTPYLPDYLPDAKAAGGFWSDKNKHWFFNGRDKEAVDAILVKHYGTTGSDGILTVSVRITAKREIRASKAPVCALGRVIAIAWGRDTGASIGMHGVANISGEMGSSGSYRNWTTDIYPGATFLVHDVAVPLLDRINTDDWTFEVITDQSTEKPPVASPIMATTDGIGSIADAREFVRKLGDLCREYGVFPYGERDEVVRFPVMSDFQITTGGIRAFYRNGALYDVEWDKNAPIEGVVTDEEIARQESLAFRKPEDDITDVDNMVLGIKP